MNKQHISAFLAISRLAFSSDQFKCGLFSDNDKNICMAVAKNKEKAARTKLEEHYKPANDSDYKIGAARIKTDYAAAV